ncbi:FAD-dependent oxidoreductase [Larkinella soli]|uniref:FAD-dependent oxidoreductase n=1 Tax=Larkinella soli TaxID=1770527 RepID=UPI000FFB2634|nr:FAD-dependent oxidoreductase [Larkinella soli]
MKTNDSMIIVGSGITALVSAFKAVEQGLAVTLLSKSPCTRTAGAGQLFQSSTHDGSYNRYITSTEGHPYLDLDGYVTQMYPDIAADFEKTIAEGGMLALPFEEFSPETQRFLLKRKALNQAIKTNQQAWLENEQLFIEYVEENICSMELWYRELAQFLAEKPRLAQELSLSLGIHRFYDEKALFESARKTLSGQGIIKASFYNEEAVDNPEFAAYQAGFEKESFIKGGALIMHGLAFNIKAVTRFLLEKLEKSGVRFLFGPGYEVTEIRYDSNHQVEALITRDGGEYASRHILFHGGAYLQPGLFRGVDAGQHVCGMKGFWAHITGKTAEKLIGGMGLSPKACKIHGGKMRITVDGEEYLSQVADLNVQPVILEKENGETEYILCIGSGYLFVGTYPFEGDTDLPKPDPQRIERINTIRKAEKLAVAGFWEVVRRVYHLDLSLEDCLARNHPDVNILEKGCIRSWSVDDRELRIVQKTRQGGVMLVHGGGNTGSTTKSMFESTVALNFISEMDAALPASELARQYENVRKSLRQHAGELTSDSWSALEDHLKAALYQLY